MSGSCDIVAAIRPMHRYDEIFESYIEQLRHARDDVLTWWRSLEEQVPASRTNANAIDEALRPYWPAGPVSHPRVLQVYRDHAAQIIAYNEAEYARLKRLASTAHPHAAPRSNAPERNAADPELLPPELLLDRLEDEVPELGGFMQELVVLPAEQELPPFSAAPNTPLTHPRAFTFDTMHDLQRGLQRLLGAPMFLPRSAPEREVQPKFVEASAKHQQLFTAYEHHLEQALVLAQTWWSGIIGRTRTSIFQRKSTVVENAFSRFFAGPASRPELQWTLHTYWTACVNLNEAQPASQRIPPEIVLLAWLDDGQHHGWLEAITCLPYWPLGMSDTGAWV